MMKAIALTPQTTNVQLIDFPEPQVKTPTQLKLQVLEVGICGTDREEVSGGRSKAPSGESQLIIGHEMVSRVVEVGTGVKDWSSGDLAVVMVRRPCAICEMCKRGNADFCQSGQYKERGIKELHGFQSEWVVDEEAFILKVPKGMEKIAVLTEPTSVGEKAIDHACRVQVERLGLKMDPKEWLRGKKAIVAGLGPVGLLAAMILRLRGAEVFGIDIVSPDNPRVKLLEAMGAHYVSDRSKIFGQIDLILEAAGVSKLDFALLPLLGMNGVYALTGVAAEGAPFPIPGGQLMRELVMKNQLVFGSVNASHAHFKLAIADLARASAQWKGVIESFITRRIPYTQFQGALQQKRADEIKTVISWNRPLS